MSDENKYTTNDMINFAIQQKPVDVKAAFDDLMMAKIHSAIEDKKIEVARQMFGDANVDSEIEDAQFEDDQEEPDEDDTTEEDDDLDLDISDDELEELLSDLENLEDDELDSEEEDNGESA